MILEEAQDEFKKLLTSLRPHDLRSFVRWTQEITDDLLTDWQEEAGHLNTEIDSLKCQVMRDCSNFTVCAIQEDLRHILPLGGILPSEEISFPETGEHASCDSTNTLHIDAFLYTEEEVDDMKEGGILPCHYCQSCKSRDIAEFTQLSHSMSKKQLVYIFRYLLPDLHGKTVLDVGSRIGAVLYGAFSYSGADTIIGVEVNCDLCQIQKTLIDKYHMNNRIRVVCDDICNCEDILLKADVVVLNNVFEFFGSTDVQKRLWHFLNKALQRKGVLLVTSPGLDTSFKTLEIDMDIKKWVKPIPAEEKVCAASDILMDHECGTGPNELHNVHLYEIL